ncbi:MAG: hypothetical protein QOH25_2803 [Acidobacteriota bacterium]|jgi:hypothetical protein|nr:hypothetical protein [Acidobacteriota bacterium]
MCCLKLKANREPELSSLRFRNQMRVGLSPVVEQNRFISENSDAQLECAL